MELAEESAVSVIPAQAGSLCSSVIIKRPIDSNSVHGSALYEAIIITYSHLHQAQAKRLWYKITSDCISVNIWPNTTCLDPKVSQLALRCECHYLWVEGQS